MDLLGASSLLELLGVHQQQVEVIHCRLVQLVWIPAVFLHMYERVLHTESFSSYSPLIQRKSSRIKMLPTSPKASPNTATHFLYFLTFHLKTLHLQDSGFHCPRRLLNTKHQHVKSRSSVRLRVENH